MFLNDLIVVGKKLQGNDFFKFSKLITKYEKNLEKISTNLYEKLDDKEKTNFMTWFLLRWGEIDTVTQSERKKYLDLVNEISAEPYELKQLGNKKYRYKNFSSQGYDVNLIYYDFFLGIHDFKLDQYTSQNVSVTKGDVIIDAGAFIGDTAIIFNAKTEGDCEIHSFELLPESINLLSENLKINGMEGNVRVNQIALHNTSGEKLYFDFLSSEGANRVVDSSKGETNFVISTTLDNYVEEKKLASVDFLKMDIEGGEILALEGAVKTILKFKPKLAICIYHIWTDPYLIPEFINSLGVEYSFDFKWVHLTRGWEAVLLAYPAPASLDDTQETKGKVSNTNMEEFIYHSSKMYQEKYIAAHSLWEETQKRDARNISHKPRSALAYIKGFLNRKESAS